MATRKKTTKNDTAKGAAKKARSAAKRPAITPVAKADVAAGAPVTLDEAKALARGKQPARAVRRAVVPPPTPEGLGAEREQLRERRRQEREQRKRDYEATMTIMKRRGARRPARAVSGRRRGTGASVAAFQPLQVLAEGDSWFDYPVPFFGGGIIPRLEDRLGVPILNMAEAGDEVRFMLGVEQRKRLVKCLTDGCPAGGPWDVMLFSGGGNDIVDNPMALWIRDFTAGTSPANRINQPRLNAALALVRAGYEDLITLRDTLSPTTHLVFHGYDFAIPDGRGICHLGPWLKPTFDLRGYRTRADAQAVVKEMLGQFAAMLATMTRTDVSLVPTQGTLAAQTSAWHNELHPNKSGFEKFADLFQKHLKGLFPTRVA